MMRFLAYQKGVTKTGTYLAKSYSLCLFADQCTRGFNDPITYLHYKSIWSACKEPLLYLPSFFVDFLFCQKFISQQENLPLCCSTRSTSYSTVVTKLSLVLIDQGFVLRLGVYESCEVVAVGLTFTTSGSFSRFVFCSC